MLRLNLSLFLLSTWPICNVIDVDQIVPIDILILNLDFISRNENVAIDCNRPSNCNRRCFSIPTLTPMDIITKGKGQSTETK